MRPFSPNAFMRDGAGRDAAPPASLAALLAPMRAEVHPAEHGVRLDLEPMRAADALAIWASISSRADAATVFFAAPAGNGRLAAPLDRSAPGLTGRGASPNPVGPEGGQFTAVLVEGPVEPSDVAAINRAIAEDRSPLAVEVRAVAVMRVVRDRAVFLEARDRTVALTFVAENFRHYLAAVRRQPVTTFSAPELSLLDRILSVTGAITVRPIETEVYSTAIDVGIATEIDGPARPATASLIYDIYGNAWYGE